MTIGIDPPTATGLRLRTLVGLLRWRGQSEPDRRAYRFLSDGEAEGGRLTYGELDARARGIAAVLQSLKAEGSRAMLLYPPGLEYVAAFFGCLYAGVVAVPAYPPRANRNAQRLSAIAADAGATLALTTEAVLKRVERAGARAYGLDSLRWLATDRPAPGLESQWAEPAALGEESLAYLQYTSGSTSAPKGVMVSHGNVLHNSAYIHHGFAHTPESLSLSWLPHFHDMGLLDGIIQPLYGGFPCILMSPSSFLQRPLGWLEAISENGVTHSGGPNFAYELCVRRAGEGARAALDLSSWRVAYNGAEPVRAETLERFADAFAPCGFRRSSLYPAYGLAEATLKVSGGRAGDGPVLLRVRAEELERHRVVEARPGERGARALVGSGRAALSTEVRVVQPETLAECAPDEVGEIWVRGPGVAPGYWRNEEATEQTFRAHLPATGEGPFMRTGDLGFVRGGELFVTGRLKDLIIIRGRNHYPQDIESAVERCHPALRPGGAAAFSVETGGEERLVIAQEVEHRRRDEWQAVVESVLAAVAEEFEARPAAVLLLRPGAVPRTSSGKVRRGAAREKFLRGDWEVVEEWRAPAGDDTALTPTRAPGETPFSGSLVGWLRERLAAMLGVSSSEIDTSRSLTRYGVDSLMAVELMHAAETTFGVSPSLADFLESPSLEQLAARADARPPSASHGAEATAAPSHTEQGRRPAGAEETWLPLSHNQRALWFLHQVSPDSTAYNVAFAARVRGGLDAEPLRRALRSLVERHAALRTSFALVEGEPAQRVHARAELFFRAVDAGGLDDDALGERLGLESRHQFDLGEPQLLRVFLFERGAAGHVLLLVAHHVVVDFWSLSVLMRELWALYEAEVSGTRADLGPQASQYADYVRRQREFLDGAEGERQRAFWRRELSGELPVLDLPLDRPRPAVQSHRGASTSLRLGEALTGNLKSLARANEATLYMTLLAAFQVLLYRHTGQRELLTGTPTSGRGSAHFSETVGYFVNPVVVRSKLSGGTAFAELLAQVRRAALAAFAHQDYPFDLLVKELQPERDPARSPLFQAMFALHRAREAGGQSLAAFALGEAGAEVTLGGRTLESVALEQRAAQFDLALTMAEVGGELAASFEFCTDLFEAATIKRLAGHFRVLLEAIVAEPSKAVAELAVLTRAEHSQLLGEWNVPPRAPAPWRPVHTEFERQAALAPERTAVVSAGGRVSYGELNERADRLARHLRARGVGPNVLVGLCVERSVEMLVGIFGVLKAGGAYVPLDPSYPRERLAFMLKDSAVACLLTQRHLSQRLPANGGHVIHLDADLPAIAREEGGDAGGEVGADNLAYVIYTSGSTGVPKGVMVGHGSLANYVAAVADEYGITWEDRLLQFASFSFDVSVEEIFASLTRGATLVLRDDEMTASPASLARACGEHGITVLNLPTAYWHQMAAGLTASEWAAAERLRLVVIGSEKVQPERLSRWHACVGARVRLVDVYGPTEATIGSTLCDLTVTGVADARAERISIGRPVRNAQAYVLDARLQPVPVGVAGELHVGGLGLALGYMGRPGLTAEKFIPHPFGHAPGARLYKTGDLARFLPDGRIEFLGRLDGQVKVRGFRIEPGEIERALEGHAGVRDALVVVREDGGEKRLVAYVVAGGADAPAAGDLRRHLKGRLPEYMLPSAFVFLDGLPLTPGGKVDTRALPAPDRARPEPAGGFVPPRGEVERALAGIWADVLKLERVGADENFFELGGDSILAISVIARAQAEGLSLTAKQMFTHPTVAELAGVTGTAPAARAGQAEQAGATGEVPLTPIQRWFFAQQFEDADHWNMAVMLEVRRPLPFDELGRALSHLVDRHEALRLRFARGEAGWRQFVTDDARAQFALARVDLSGTAEAERPAAVEAAAAEAQSRLSLSEGPLLRAVLFEPGEAGTPRLLLVAHHLIVDGVSWGILLEDLASLCEQSRRGVPFELPPKTTSFKAWAERLESYAASAEARAGADYWSALASKELRGLPVDYPGGTNGEDDARTVSVTLGAEETRALLHEVPTAYHTQINDVLLTALVAAFARRTGESELLLELESHGREELFDGVNLSRTIGWFTSASPVLLRLGEPFAPGEALKSVKEQLRAIPGNGINYGVLRYLNADARAGDAPPFGATPQPGVSFNYLGRLDHLLDDASPFRPAREGVGPTRGGRNRRTHLLEVNAGVYDGRLRVDWSYSAGLHTKTTVEALAAGYLSALGEIIAHCLSPGAGGHTPSDFPLARLDQRGLDALLKATGPVADLYPLTPTQQGMLFHCLYSPEAGVYMGQLSCVIEGGLDVSAFAEAWRRGAERHASLRASFVWENLDEPLQVVAQSVEVEPEVRDWRGSSPAEQARLLDSFLSDDWERAFDLGRAPLMRLALLRTADETYRFVWTHHHLLLDGWSASLLMREVLDIYEALRRGVEPPPARARAFRDYVRWLREQDAATAEGFWREELKGFTSPTPLPAGWPAADEPPRACKRQLRLSPEETAGLQGFARRHQLTLSTLVHGAFALLLSRYSAEEDVVFGTAVSGRPPALAGVDSMTGLFINTLPVRARVADAAPALPWLKGLQERLVALREYEHSSLAEVQRASDVPHGTPLFESLLVFENYPMDATLGGLEGHLKLGDVRSFELTNYPLTVVALPGAELSLQALFTSDRFDAATVERLLGHLKSLLLDIAANPAAPLGGARLLGEDERRLMLEGWNAAAHAYPRGVGVGKLFGETAAARPEAAALVAGGRRMSFGELNRRANRVAHHLRRLGVGPESIVGVCLERSPEMVVGLLGALKAGAAYMPMDPAYPRDRLTFMARDARSTVLLTQASLGELFADEAARVLRLDADWEVFAREPEGDPPNVVEPENLAYVIYTSGSTGRPKGVAVTQASLLNFIGWYRRTFAVTPSDRSTFLSGIGFDVSVMDLWPNLTAGVCVFIPDEETRLAAEKLRDWFVANEITVGFAATPMAEMLLELSWPETAALRTLTTGGDKLHRYPKDSLRFNVANLYGPTENTVVTTFEVSEPGGDEPTTSPPIGRPLDNVRVYLLDRRLRPVPVGVTGELYVGGAGLARGYWGRPDMTAERFIPHPFSAEPGARLYRIGDLARYLPDGRLEFLGRVDFQVKIRGYRIELGEIETVLASHESVGAAAVVVRGETAGEKRLAAYVVAADEERAVSAGELRAYLRERLPEYMVPAGFVVLRELPLTPNGKVDRRALPADGAPAGGEEFVAPRNPVEEALADIWRDVLGVERVGVNDNFFDLGGHSLMATRVLSNVRRLFRLELPLRVLFESHTVAELALAILPYETRPGQAEKIARVLQKLKGASAEEVRRELQRKRRERESR